MITKQEHAEAAAVDHVSRSLAENGLHSETSCPYPMRAMCRYRRTIKAMKEKGTWPDHLDQKEQDSNVS